MPLLIQVVSGRSILLVEKKEKETLTQKSVTTPDGNDIPEG